MTNELIALLTNNNHLLIATLVLVILTAIGWKYAEVKNRQQKQRKIETLNQKIIQLEKEISALKNK